MAMLKLLVLLTLGLHALSVAANAQPTGVQLAAMLDLKAAFKGAGAQLASWSIKSPCYKWQHVLCDSKNNVVALTLGGLMSTVPKGFAIPASIGNLTFLDTLDLSYNTATEKAFPGGPIPASLGKCKRLTYLDLGSNKLTGTVPQSLFQLTKLGYLNLAGNSFAGSLPVAVGNLTSLTFLDTSYSFKGGAIPPSIGNCRALQQLGLNSNGLTGTIPRELGAIKGLAQLDLSDNALVGPLPSSFANLKQLNFLNLANNSFSGPVPPVLLALSKLNQLLLDNNKLSGVITPKLGTLKQLTGLGLSFNSFVGTVPRELFTLPKLERLALGSNQLTGSLSNFTSAAMADFSADNNYLTGSPVFAFQRKGHKCTPSGYAFVSNCFASARDICGQAVDLRAEAECAAFCGLRSKAGVCGGHGVCTLSGAPEGAPKCLCAAGFKRGVSRGTCVRK